MMDAYILIIKCLKIPLLSHRTLTSLPLQFFEDIKLQAQLIHPQYFFRLALRLELSFHLKGRIILNITPKHLNILGQFLAMIQLNRQESNINIICYQLIYDDFSCLTQSCTLDSFIDGGMAKGTIFQNKCNICYCSFL